MDKEDSKRKIKIALTLEGKHIQRKTNLEKIEENIDKVEIEKTENLTEETKKDTFFESTNTVGPFQLVVYKLPWYKKAFRSLVKFLGFKLEY